MKINKRKVAASLEAEGVGAQVQLNLELTDYNPSSFLVRSVLKTLYPSILTMSFVTDFFNHFSEKAMISESVKSTHILIKSILFTRLCTLIWKSCSLFLGLNSSDVLSCVSSRPGLG